VRLDIEVNGRSRQVLVRRVAGKTIVTVDGRAWAVDVVRIDGHCLSLLLDKAEAVLPAVPGSSGRAPAAADALIAWSAGGSSLEVAISPVGSAGPPGTLAVRVGRTQLIAAVNGRRRAGRHDDSRHGDTGPQRLLAPMPGKVVRVLVKVGDQVRARQPIVVVEAMKMENELRARADGTVAELPVRDGQSVDAGTLVALIRG
jgi:biotin carboxyl carrier protein